MAGFVFCGGAGGVRPGGEGVSCLPGALPCALGEGAAVEGASTFELVRILFETCEPGSRPPPAGGRGRERGRDTSEASESEA